MEKARTMTWSGPVHLNNYLKLSPVTDKDIKTCVQLKQQKDSHLKLKGQTTPVATPLVDVGFYILLIYTTALKMLDILPYV